MGITVVFVFYIRDISDARSCYFDVFSASLSLTRKFPRTAISMMNVSWSVIVHINEHISERLASITRLVLMLKFYKTFVFWFSITLSALSLCSYQFLAVSKLYLLHSSQWTTVATLSWHFLYSVGLSFEDSLRICVSLIPLVNILLFL